MKKRRNIIIILFLIVLCITGLVFFLTMNKTYPSDAVYSSESVCYSESGMYYARGNMLYFFDVNSEKEVILCSRPNCNHDSEECNAYVEALRPLLMYYDGELYVASAVSDITFEDGDAMYSGSISLDCISRDGSRKRNIYQADNGAVTSMKAVDGTLYFTAYVFHGDFEENTYLFDESLYKYDLRWKRTKRLCTYEPEDGQSSSSLMLVSGDSKDINMIYSVTGDDGTQKTTLIQYENGRAKDLAVFDTIYADFVINKTGGFLLLEYADDEQDMSSIYELNDDYTNKKELFNARDAHIDVMNGYIMIINSDYNKVLYNLNTGNTYIANTSFQEEGKYISDIYDIDEKRNRIYINLTDYTGILPGTIFYEDNSNKGVADLDSFLKWYFTDKESVAQDELDKLDWITFEE